MKSELTGLTATKEHFVAGNGFRLGTVTEANELVLRISADLAHEIGVQCWRSLPSSEAVYSRRVEFLAALLNISERMDWSLLGKHETSPRVPPRRRGRTTGQPPAPPPE